MLQNEYDILTATNGIEAIDILKEKAMSISAILLDLVMPEMNGFEVLKKIKDEIFFSQIPIIVETSETNSESKHKALALGAVTYITKPFDSEAIRYSISNIIRLSESVINVSSQIDSLTGLYKREAFFEKIQEMISRQKPGYYTLSCFDIDKFKVINDLYGTEKGDEVLKHIGNILSKGIKKSGGVCCRVSADNFSVLYPTCSINSRMLAKIKEDASTVEGFVQPLLFSVGRYVIKEPEELTPSAMYDRAIIAKATIKGHFDECIATFTESMLDSILLEQNIVSEMKIALDQKQFEVWYQPQFNHETGALVGAEALVRWRHPQKGLIPPTVFIPIFEKNGFVYEIDKYVWEQSCIFLRETLNEKIKTVPISVNISRCDIFRGDLVPVILSLTEKYNLTPDLLRLEITESAFAKSEKQIIEIVERFRASGFTVEIDDFGSGYSSLNTLKDVPADILKLDMKFLQGEENSEKGGNIVASMVRMSKWLGMSVIAEGVEFIQQANFLKSIGCNYIQGFLYSKPLIKSEYKNLLSKNATENKMTSLEKLETYDVESFWSPTSMDTLIFNTFVGGACICEYYNGTFSTLRCNEKYAKIVSGGTLSESQVLNLKFEDFIPKHDLEKVAQNLKTTIRNCEETSNTIEILRSKGKENSAFVRIAMRVIAQTNNRSLLYILIEDITLQIEAQKQQKNLSVKLEAILNNMINGVSLTSRPAFGSSKTDFANNRYFEQRGYTRDEFLEEVTSLKDIIHEDDRKRVSDECNEGYKTQKPFTTSYRIVKRDGTICWITNRISYAYFTEYKTVMQISITEDITKQKILLDKLQTLEKDS